MSCCWIAVVVCVLGSVYAEVSIWFKIWGVVDPGGLKTGESWVIKILQMKTRLHILRHSPEL